MFSQFSQSESESRTFNDELNSLINLNYKIKNENFFNLPIQSKSEISLKIFNFLIFLINNF